jgi:hypothetical protein
MQRGRNTVWKFETLVPLRLYDMSNIETLGFLKKRMDAKGEKLVDACFPIRMGQVHRQSTLHTDKALFEHMVQAGLIIDDIRGWIHDDFDESHGNHKAELVLTHPDDSTLRNMSLNTPTSPVGEHFPPAMGRDSGGPSTPRTRKRLLNEL